MTASRRSLRYNKPKEAFNVSPITRAPDRKQMTQAEGNSRPKSGMLRIGDDYWQAVDLSALRSLMDRDDEAFLHERLSRSEFFRIKRFRIQVTWKYVHRIYKMSAILKRHVASSPQDLDVNLAEAARKVADVASQVLIQCRVVFAKLTVEYMFPAICLRIYTR